MPFEIRADDPLFETARDKVVILTGGATGIGEATLRLLVKLGAHVFFLDTNREVSEKLVDELGSELTFYHGSVSVWSDQLRVFEAAIEKHGCVDVVIGNAGINEVEDVFVDSFDEGGKLKAPTLVVLDVNIRGAIYTTKLALSFFRKLGIKGSLVLTGSAASYLDTPGIPVYNAAKHGVIGLVRSLRDTLREEGLVRVNVVAPWFTATPFTAKLTEKWKANGLPANQPIDVAWALLYVALNEEYNSKSLFVADGKYTELEDPIQATRNLWLGEQNTAWVDQRRAHKIKLGKQDA